MVESEPKVPASAAMPRGYGFLPKGDPYRTGLCRRLTQAAGKQVYVVVDKRRTAVGIRAPKYIINEVHEKDRATREDRLAAVQKRDVATRSDFEVAILRLFPKIPPQHLEKVLDRALKKRSGRVGRTGKLTIDSKARLAVMAHIRHNHTEYDSLLKQKGKSRGSARDDIAPKLKQLCGEWREGAKSDAAHINEAPISATQGSRGRTNQDGTRISRRARRLAAAIPEGKHEGQYTTNTKTCTHDNKGHTAPRDPPRGQNRKRHGKKETVPLKPVTGTKTRRETRQTRNTSNLDKAKLLGPDALIVISSDESDPEDPEDTDLGGESDNSFIVGGHSDHYMDEDWEIDLDSNSDSDLDEEMEDIE